MGRTVVSDRYFDDAAIERMLQFLFPDGIWDYEVSTYGVQ